MQVAHRLPCRRPPCLQSDLAVAGVSTRQGWKNFTSLARLPLSPRAGKGASAQIGATLQRFEGAQRHLLDVKSAEHKGPVASRRRRSTVAGSNSAHGCGARAECETCASAHACSAPARMRRCRAAIGKKDMQSNHRQEVKRDTTTEVLLDVS